MACIIFVRLIQMARRSRSSCKRDTIHVQKLTPLWLVFWRNLCLKIGKIIHLWYNTWIRQMIRLIIKPL